MRCSHRHPSTVVLLKHDPTGRLALFDLGINSNWRDVIPANEQAAYDFFDVKVEADLVDVLAAKGIKPDDISTVILSRASPLCALSRPCTYTEEASPPADHHFDHVGDARQFPSAQFICGPDTRHKIRALDGHDNVLVLSWDESSPRVATFEHSYDVWGDGSCVLVDASGHTSGHIAALLRTGGCEYVLAAADCCHHPRLLAPDKGEEHYRLGKWREDGEPEEEAPRHSNYDDHALAEQTLERVKSAHRREDVMVVLAHDFRQWEAWGPDKMARRGVELNGWRSNGLKV